jgi:hypothetical protein
MEPTDELDAPNRGFQASRITRFTNGNPPLDHRRLSSQILHSLPLHRSIELAGVGSRRAVLGRLRDNRGDSASVEIRRPPRSRSECEGRSRGAAGTGDGYSMTKRRLTLQLRRSQRDAGDSLDADELSPLARTASIAHDAPFFIAHRARRSSTPRPKPPYGPDAGSELEPSPCASIDFAKPRRSAGRVTYDTASSPSNATGNNDFPSAAR